MYLTFIILLHTFRAIRVNKGTLDNLPVLRALTGKGWQ